MQRQPETSARARWRESDPWIVGPTAIVATLLVVGLVNTWLDGSDDQPRLYGLVALGVVGLGLAVRGNPAAAVVAAVLVAAESLDPAPGGTWAVAGGLLFLFAVQHARLESVVAGVAFAATGVLANTPWATGLDIGVIGFFSLATAMVGVAQWVQAQRRYVVAEVGRRREETERRRVEVARSVAEERLRIARDLHDSVAHHIAVVSVQTNLARASLSVSTDAADRALQVVQTAARDVLADLQRVLGVLRDEPSAAEPPPGVRPDRVGDLAATYGEIGLRIESTGLDLLASVPDQTGAALYRVLQEAFTNAHRYGDGHATLSVERTPDDVLEVTVRNAVDASTVALSSGGGHGLVGMTERVSELGGSLATGVDGPEFVVRARVPLDVVRTPGPGPEVAR